MAELTHLPRLVGRFALVGVANTAVGYSVIFALMACGVDPVLSNVTGYAAGILLGFALQRLWVYQARASFHRLTLPYAASIAIAYGCNLAVLRLLLVADLSPYLAQIAASVTYAGVQFCLSTFWVFAEHD